MDTGKDKIMIEKENNEFVLKCDFCSTYVDGLYDFEEAVAYKKLNNWKSIRSRNEWFDKCPNCVEENKKWNKNTYQ